MAHPQSRVGAMSQLNGIHRQLGESPRTPKSLTIEQLMRGQDGSRWQLRTSPIFGREHDMEEDHTPTHRKSVLAKVKEKARKWRSTLSKKKHNEDGNSTPSWGVSLEDEDDEEDEDPEYLGAPMYESELAPEGYKVTARQHPRAIPVVSEKHVLTSSVNTAKSVRTTPRARSAAVTPKAEPKTISETVADKLAPAYATVTEATYAIASKIQSLAIPGPEQEASSSSPIRTATNSPTNSSTPPVSPAKRKPSPRSLVNPSFSPYRPVKPSLAPVVAEKSSDPPTPSPRGKALTPQAPPAVETKQQDKATQEALEKAVPVSAPAAVATTSNHPSAGEQIWDKGVSVKDYIMNKLEPGDDEKALSQVISQAISPRKSPGEASVVEKVREAVTSLLRNDDSSRSQKQRFVFHSAQNSSSNVPISINPHEIVEEESHGRILQAN